VATRAVILRPATTADAQAVALVHRAAFDQALSWILPLHTPAEDLAYFSGLVVDQSTTVAERDGQVVGFTSYLDCWLNQLYVSPSEQSNGIGGTLLRAVKTEHESVAPNTPLQLWTFQANAGARRFYERHAFVAVEFTDGSRNEEREPDVRYEWVSD